MSIQQSSKHSESDCTKMCSFKCKNYFQHSEIHTLCEAGRNWDQARKDQVYIYNSPRINPKISEHFKLLFSLPLSDFFFVRGRECIQWMMTLLHSPGAFFRMTTLKELHKHQLTTQRIFTKFQVSYSFCFYRKRISYR